MLLHQKSLATTAALAALTLSASAVPIPTLSWDANSPLSGNEWDPTINAVGGNIRWVKRSGVTPTRNSGSTNFASINNWISNPNYEFRGPIPPSANTGRDSWQDVLGDPSTKADASWEMVFRPGDYDGKHTLFNTGGAGAGTAILLEGSKLEFRIQSSTGTTNQIYLDLSLSNPIDEFIHVVGVADLDNPISTNGAVASLYVNGSLVDSGTASNLQDWDGGDTAELGWGTNIPGTNSYAAEPFGGDIALFNYYNSALTASDIAARKAAVPDGGSSALLLGLSILGFGAARRKLRK